MSLAQLKNITKDEIHAIIQRDNSDDVKKLQDGINEINRKLDDEVINKLEEIPKMKKM